MIGRGYNDLINRILWFTAKGKKRYSTELAGAETMMMTIINRHYYLTGTTLTASVAGPKGAAQHVNRTRTDWFDSTEQPLYYHVLRFYRYDHFPC